MNVQPLPTATPLPANPSFISANTPLLLSRFALSYQHAFTFGDYYITSIETGMRISKEILFTLDPLEKRIVVSRFYPQLVNQVDSKYLSATCFYLMLHHFAAISKIGSHFDIYLTAAPSVFTQFYQKLDDFHFQAHGLPTDKTVEVTSAYDCALVDTSMIARLPDA